MGEDCRVLREASLQATLIAKGCVSPLMELCAMAQAWWEIALQRAEVTIACWLHFAVVVGMVDDDVHVVVLDACGKVPRAA